MMVPLKNMNEPNSLLATHNQCSHFHYVDRIRGLCSG